MSSNIELIRSAQTQIEVLRDELRKLNDKALADDGRIDKDEKAGIDRVEGKINNLKHVVSLRQKAWEANRAEYNKLHKTTSAGLNNVKGCEDPEFSKDQKAILDAAPDVDAAAKVEDYGNAVKLIRDLIRSVELFEKERDNKRLEGMTDEELVKAKLMDPKDVEAVFGEDYMRELMDVEIKGEGSPKLKTLMAELGVGISSTRRLKFMTDLEAVVGTPPSAKELDADYARYLVLRKQRDAIGKKNNSGDVPDLDGTKHQEFEASRGQLLFGKALGDALGIHEVFASALSPTGGLIGPGNELAFGMDAQHWSPDNPIALHGTVHDAAGYLKAYHDDGPGYNYRENWFESCATGFIELFPQETQNEYLPYTGQASGIAYWIKESGDEYLEARYDEGVMALEKALADARNGAAEKVGDLISNIETAKKVVADSAEALKDDMIRRKEEAEQEIRDFAEKAEKKALDAVEGFENAVKSGSSSAVEAYEEASAEARAIGEGAMEKLDAVADFIWS